MKKLLVSICIAIASLNVLAADKIAPKVIEIQATDEGFKPNAIDVQAGTPVILKVTRTSDLTCATEIHFQNSKLNKDLPLNQTVSIDLGKVKKGKIDFNCGMKMFKGQLNVN
jgi:plastocyanin domain-containing protein